MTLLASLHSAVAFSFESSTLHFIVNAGMTLELANS